METNPAFGLWSVLVFRSWLQAHALERAQGLAHVVDFLLAGLLLTHGMADGVPQLGKTVDGLAEASLDALHLYEGGFECGLGFLLVYAHRGSGAVGYVSMFISVHGMLILHGLCFFGLFR